MTRKEELLLQMNNLSEKIDKIRSKADYSKITSFQQWANLAAREVAQWNVCSREYRTLKEPKMQPIPSFGHLYIMEDFIEEVDSGLLMDYDGSGNYANETEMTDITIKPSDIIAGVYRNDFEYVVWFNR